jgi:hypothetical protein
VSKTCQVNRSKGFQRPARFWIPGRSGLRLIGVRDRYCAGRGLQPRPPLRGGNVSDRTGMQDLTLRTGLQTPSRGAQFFFCAGRGLQPRPPLRGGNVSDRTGMQDLTLRTGVS